MQPLAALWRISFLLERANASTARVKAFRNAAKIVAEQGSDIERRARSGTLQELAGIGASTSAVITEALQGEVPTYLRRLEEDQADGLVRLSPDGRALREQLRGDLHSHSDWSDGGSTIEEMAVTAAELGRQYQALTDHSPRLTVANGLSAQRLREQLEVVEALRSRLGAMRLLSGIEVDIHDDGSLDQNPDLLSELDIVVASVHSKLKMETAAMTRRMLAAVADRHTDVLGHCTGRLIGSKKRAQSSFDAAAVFDACAEAGVAVEINCRPERLDPPEDLLQLAVASGCLFSMDTDAHAPGQLDWLDYGCDRAVRAGVPPDRIVTTWPLERVLEWTRRRR